MSKVINEKFYDLKYDLVFKRIIVDDNDYTIMNSILSDILEKEVKVKRYLNSELKIKEIVQINLNFNEGENKPLKEEYLLWNK